MARLREGRGAVSTGREMTKSHIRTDSKTGRFMPIPLEERFWSKVLKTDGCWIWQGGLDYDGYGQIKNVGTDRAARVSWRIANGAIPKGLVVDHICRVRSCVNPSHLRLLTNTQNILCGEGVTARNARKTHCPRGHALEGDNLYRYPDGRRSCQTCQRARKAALRAN